MICLGTGYHIFNGHRVIEKFPVNRLFKADGGTVVRVSLYDKRMPDDEAVVYVSKRCCRKKGGDDGEGTSVYDVMLIDDKYSLHYGQYDKRTNSRYFVDSGICVSPEELCDIAEKTIQREARHKRKGYIRGTIDFKYCVKRKYADEESISGVIENTISELSTTCRSGGFH